MGDGGAPMISITGVNKHFGALHVLRDVTLSVAPGETIEFKVSCDEPGSYRADLVRLIHGDTNPAGPGFKEEVVESAVNGSYAGRHQPIASGSHVIVDDGDGALAVTGAFTLHAFDAFVS